MNFVKTIWILCGAIAVSSEAAQPTAGELNVALKKWGTSARGSSIYGAGYEADNVLDGKWAGENDKWNSAANATPHWLIVDLGQNRTIHKIVIRHEGVRGTGDQYNLSDFQVQRGESATGPWSDVVPPVVGNTDKVTELTFTPKPVRYLRVFITMGEQGGKNEYARVYEVEAYAARSTLPTPLPDDYFCNGGTLSIVSSSHQDTAWMDTPDFCRQFRINQNIIPALEMMAKDPQYTFAMECTLHLMEVLEAHPERKDEIIRLTREGRLEWGATYNQPYESWLSGEELVRQTYYGRRWIRKNLPGCDARVAFNPDVPGRALQMQQILAKAGIPYLLISRYHEGLYRWRSPDGSSVLAYTPGHYYNPSHLLNAKPADAVAGITRKLAEEGSYYQQRKIPPAYCLLNSQDFSRPTDFRPLINLWNSQPPVEIGNKEVLKPPTMQYGSIGNFFRQIDSPLAKVETLLGERPNVWAYITGPTHHWTSHIKREAARVLPAAETFTTISCLLAGSFDKWPKRELDQTWQDEIYIDHGIGGKNGHITDEVFRRKVASADAVGSKLLVDALRSIASQVTVNTNLGRPCVVFNTLSWARSEPVRVMSVESPCRVVDADGHEVPSQLTTNFHFDEVNVAADQPAMASSVFSAEYGAANAVDRRWDVSDSNPATGKSAKWTTAKGALGPHWLMVDFGEPRTIHKVVVWHEGVMGRFGAETAENTADFQIQGADAADGPWTDLVPPITGNVASLTTHAFAPKRVRFLRLFITKGTQRDNSFARIYEVEAFEKRPPAAELVFMATDVPALGYQTYYLEGHAPSWPRAADGRDGACPSNGCENDFYRIELAPGGIKSIFDKQLKRELLDTSKFLGGEVFTLMSPAPNNRGQGTDAGEFGSIPLPVVDETFDRVAAHKPEWKQLESGPVRSVFQLEQPLADVTVRQRLIVWNTIKRLDCEVDLRVFNGKLWREFRMALPLAMAKPQLTYEVPFGVVEVGKDEIPGTGGHAYGNLTYSDKCRDIHPREVQNFVDVSDTKGGVTMSSSVSVIDWEGACLQPVLLASRKSCNGQGNWYPQAGNHSYRFSITSHAGGWRNSWRAGIGANYQLMPIQVSPDKTPTLPTEKSFFSVSPNNALISTIKKCEDDDGVIVRCYDIEGKDSRAEIASFVPLKGAEQTNLLEEDGRPLAVTGATLKLGLGHHAIETLKLRPKGEE